MMTESNKKKLAAALDMRAVVSQINKAIASPNLQESVIGKRNRTKLLNARSAVFQVIDEWEGK